MSQKPWAAPEQRIGFVGVGRMGSTLLKCVLGAGYRATLCDPSEQATAPFVAAHPDRVRVALTPRKAAQSRARLEHRRSRGQYERAAPGCFVEAGGVITRGTTVCMLEVMKTYSRIAYGGESLPERARVVSILIADGADVELGTPILQLEPV